jgi:hypothetical protein
MSFDAASRREYQHAIVVHRKVCDRAAGTTRVYQQLAGTRQAIQHAGDILAGEVRPVYVELVFVIVVTAMPDQVECDLISGPKAGLQSFEVSEHVVACNLVGAKYADPLVCRQALRRSYYRRDLFAELFRVARLAAESFYNDNVQVG